MRSSVSSVLLSTSRALKSILGCHIIEIQFQIWKSTEKPSVAEHPDHAVVEKEKRQNRQGC